MQKLRQKSPSVHHRTLCRAISSQLRHVSTIGKKLVKRQYLSICLYIMANFVPLTAEIRWRVWGTPAISTGFTSWLRYCTNVAQRRSTKLCTMFDVSCTGILYMHFWRHLPLTEFCQLQHSLNVQVLRSCTTLQ